MDTLRWSSYAAFVLAATALAIFIFDGLFVPFLGVALSLGVSGLLLLALDDGLRLLTEIRDGMLRQSPMVAPRNEVIALGGAVGPSPKTVAELAGDIDRMKNKLG